MRKHKVKEINENGVIPCGGGLYNLYIFKERKWVKIGEYCTECGVINLSNPSNQKS